MGSRNKRARAIMLVALALAATACGGGSGGDDGGDSGSDAAGDTADALPVTVTAQDFSFAPDEIVGHATHTIDLTFVNEGEAEHSFTIDDLDVDASAPGGSETSVTFTPEEPGTLEYYCRFHPDQMTGELTVE